MEGRLRSMSRFLIHDIIQQCDARPRETKRKFGESCLLLQFVVFTVVLENFNEVWKQSFKFVINQGKQAWGLMNIKRLWNQLQNIQKNLEKLSSLAWVNIQSVIQTRQLPRFVVLLWALPTPQTILAIGSDQEIVSSGWKSWLSHKDCHVKAFSCSYLELRCENCKRSKWRFFSP